MSYLAEVLADSPAGLWLLDDNPVVTAVDVSGNGRDGTYSGGVTHSADTPVIAGAGSADFGGVDGKVNVADNDVWTSTAFSTEAWVRLDAVAGATRTIIAKNHSTSAQEWTVVVDATGKVVVILRRTDQTTYRRLDTTASIPSTGWHHIVVTTDGTTIAVYFDGVAQAGTATGPFGTRAGNTSAPLTVGRSAGNTNPFAGLIYGAAFYPSQLSAARVLAHFEAATSQSVTLGPAPAETTLAGPSYTGGLAPSTQNVTLGPAPALTTLPGPWLLSEQAVTLGAAPALTSLGGPWVHHYVTLGAAPALAVLAGPSSTGTAPWDVPGGPDLAAWVYDRAGGLVGTLSDSFLRTWHEILSDVGDWRLSLADDVVLAHAVYGHIVRLALSGTPRFAGLLESKAATTAAPGEEVDEVTVCSGRGTLAIWEEALILTVLGVDRRAFSEYRMFNFASPDLDISAWTAVASRAQSIDPDVDPGSHNTVPQRWPDPGALKIWMDWLIGDRPAPGGDVYAGATFSVSPPAGTGTYRVFATADDGYEVWIDGDYVLGETTPLIWNETATTEVSLDAGTHTIRMKGTNLNFPDNSDNVAWMMCSVMETTDGGATLGAVVAHTDAAWVGVGYPAVPPGFSPGTILRLLLAEAQARGALIGVTLGFTDSADSAEVPWPITSDVAFQVGSDMLSAIKQLCETYMDVAMDPASLRLDAWVARGTTTAVTLARSTDLTAGNVTEMHHDGSA